MRLRAYIHATEEPSKVLQAVRNVVPGSAVVTPARGHRGNFIGIVEVELRGCDALIALRRLLSRLDSVERALLLSGIDRDDFALRARLDKQAAYMGRLALAAGDDVIALEAKFDRSSVGDVADFLKSI